MHFSVEGHFQTCVRERGNGVGMRSACENRREQTDKKKRSTEQCYHLDCHLICILNQRSPLSKNLGCSVVGSSIAYELKKSLHDTGIGPQPRLAHRRGYRLRKSLRRGASGDVCRGGLGCTAGKLQRVVLVGTKHPAAQGHCDARRELLCNLRVQVPPRPSIVPPSQRRQRVPYQWTVHGNRYVCSRCRSNSARDSTNGKQGRVRYVQPGTGSALRSLCAMPVRSMCVPSTRSLCRAPVRSI
jgi:hypothetical protein